MRSGLIWVLAAPEGLVKEGKRVDKGTECHFASCPRRSLMFADYNGVMNLVSLDNLRLKSQD